MTFGEYQSPRSIATSSLDFGTAHKSFAFSSMSSPATFCNVPVSTRFDGQTPSSSVSLDWVINSGLRTRASQLSGLLTLPCHAGVISMCLNNVPVTASLTSDLVLGLDWLRFVKNSAPELVVHLSCGGPLDLSKIGSAFAPSSTGV